MIFLVEEHFNAVKTKALQIYFLWYNNTHNSNCAVLSSRGLGRCPLKAKTRVQISLGPFYPVRNPIDFLIYIKDKFSHKQIIMESNP